jgi:hypothetical protein
MRLAVILLVFACGGAKPAPPRPKPLDAKGLAKLLDEDLERLVSIAHDQRGNCKATIEELGAHVMRMKNHETEVKRMLDDAQQAAELEKELATYASHATGKAELIVNDLALTHAACTKLCVDRCGDGCTEKVCEERYQLERVIASMPTY